MEAEKYIEAGRVVEAITNKSLQNLHILVIKDIPATNTKPARIKIISERTKGSVTISYSNEPGAPNGMLATAEKYLKELGFEIIGCPEGNHEPRNHYDYLISTTFNKP